MNINDLKEVRYDKAIALRDADKVDEALRAMQALLADFPDFALAQLAVAALYAKQGLPEAAFSAAVKACELDSGNPFFFTALSSLAIKAGHHQEAEDALMKAQEIRFNIQIEKMRALKEQEENTSAASDSTQEEQDSTPESPRE